MESFFWTLKMERVQRKVHRTSAHARADVLNFIEVFYNPKSRRLTIRCVSPVKLKEVLVAWVGGCDTGSCPISING